MAVPKRKISTTRGRKRRTHWKLKDSNSINVCSQTGETHLRHRAYYVDGVLYYKGKPLHSKN